MKSLRKFEKKIFIDLYMNESFIARISWKKIMYCLLRFQGRNDSFFEKFLTKSISFGVMFGTQEMSEFWQESAWL